MVEQIGVCDPNTLSLLAQFRICSCQQLLCALVRSTAIHPSFWSWFREGMQGALIPASSTAAGAVTLLAL